MDQPNTADVRAVLRYLARDRTPTGTPLADLLLVRRQVASAGLRPTPHACTHEIGCLITEVVEAEIEALRARQALPQRGSPTDWLQHLVSDFRSGHQELESWSAIYHVYLRPDLNLTLGNLQSLLGDRHRRTIQRRLRHGTEALTLRLQTLEREAAAQSGHVRMTAWGPAAWQSPCLGRGPLVRTVTQQLTRQGQPKVTALGGPPGIGKTAVALQVAAAFSEPPSAFDVVWIDARRSLRGASDGTELGRLIAARTGSEGSPSSPRPSGPPLILLVVDAVDEPAAASALIRQGLDLPPTVAVLFAGRVGWPTADGLVVLEVPPLPIEAGLHLLHDEAAALRVNSVTGDGGDKLRSLASAVGGHPALLRAAASELRHASASDLTGAFRAGTGPAAAHIDALWSGQWARVGTTSRRVVGLVVALEAEGRPADAAQLQRQWTLDPRHLSSGLREAVEIGLLSPSGSAARPAYTSALRLGSFVRNRAQEQTASSRLAAART